jgi:Polysaccharide biosynthesis
MFLSYERRCLIFRALFGRITTSLAAAWPTRLTLKLLREGNSIVMNAAELLTITRVIRSVPHCRLLVFGVGRDSSYWLACNRGGSTCFVEHDASWAEQIAGEIGKEKIVMVNYSYRRTEWRTLLATPERLSLKLPPEIADIAWDVILVDGPTGWLPEHPGRMQSIYTAASLSPRQGHVFVHDCDRELEQLYSDRFLGSENLCRQVGTLRQYRKPS